MNELTSCPPPKGKACVAGSVRFGAIFCVDSGDCVTLKIRPREVVAADCSITSTTYEILDAANLVIGLHTGGLVRVPCEALRVKLVDACVTEGGPTPVASLNIEFSETLLYSASTEQSLMRIRQYNEVTGVWALRYENLDGTAFTGALPSDLVAQTAQVNVTRTNTPGCTGNVAYTQRETARFDAETGALESELIDWVDSTGAVFVVAPAGFTLGACVDPAVAQIAANTAQTVIAVTQNTLATTQGTTTIAGAITAASNQETLAIGASTATLSSDLAALNTTVVTTSTAEIGAINFNGNGIANTITNTSAAALNQELISNAASVLAANQTTTAVSLLIDLEHVTTDGCVAGVYTPRLDTFSYNQTTGLRVPVDVQYLVGGVWGATTPLNWIAGPCPVAVALLVEKTVCASAFQGASGVFAGLYAEAGQSIFTLANKPGLQSFTVTAVRAAGAPFGANYVKVALNNNGGTPTAARLTEEYPSYTWSVAQDNGQTAERLNQNIFVEAFGDAAFLVVWTSDCPPDPS